MKNQNLIIGILVAVIAAGVGFFGGIQYQKFQRPSASQFAGGFQRMGGQRFQNGFRPVVGQIVSVDSTGITVKLTDGSSKIIIIPESALINKSAAGTKDDLKTGETVAVFGAQNTDGSMTAQSIQLNPEMRLRGSMTPLPTQ